MELFATVFEGDALSITLALALLAMSVASWTVIFYKAWLLHRVSADVAHGKAAFWQARDVAQGLQALASVDRSVVLLPLAQALSPAPAHRRRRHPARPCRPVGTGSG